MNNTTKTYPLEIVRGDGMIYLRRGMRGKNYARAYTLEAAKEIRDAVNGVQRWTQLAQGYKICASCGVGSEESRHGSMCIYYPPNEQMRSAEQFRDELSQEAAALEGKDTDLMCAKMEAAAAWGNAVAAWRAYDDLRKRLIGEEE